MNTNTRGVYDIGGKKVNLKSVLPLKLRDWKALKASDGINPNNLEEVISDIDKLSAFIGYILKKANKEVTDDDIDDLDLDQIFEMFSSVTQTQDQVDPPISG